MILSYPTVGRGPDGPSGYPARNEPEASVALRHSFGHCPNQGGQAYPSTAAENAPPSVDVPLTAGMADQLNRLRMDLGHTNVDRLDACDGASNAASIAEVQAEVRDARMPAQALDQLISASSRVSRAGDA
jgi:hypothetical protein